MLTVAGNGLRLSGIWPPEGNVFSEVDILPSVTMNITLTDVLSHHVRRLPPAQFHTKPRSFGLELLNLRHQVFLVKVSHTSFQH
jgi:hypothetical protein